MPVKPLKDIVFREDTPKPYIRELWSNMYKEDPFFNDVYMVIDLVFANGLRHRIATDEIDLLNSLGETIGFCAELSEEPSIEKTIDILSGQAQQRVLSIKLSARKIKPLDIMKEVGLIAGFGEISLIKVGDIYENRYPLIKGDMVGGVTFGANEEFMEIQISDPELSINKLIPEHFISPERNPYASDSSGEWNGDRYPIVLYDYPAVPCLRLSAHTLGPPFLACEGWSHEVESVYIGSLEREFTANDPIFGVNPPSYVVNQAIDSSGGRYTEIDFLYQQGMTPWEDGETVYAKLKHKTMTGSNSIIQLIEVILQRYSNLGNDFIDKLLISNSQRKLNKYLAKICINGSGSNDTASVTSYIEENICNSFPMINMAYTGFGYAPIVIERRDEIIKAELVRGQNLLFDRVSSLTESPREDIYNIFALKYNYDPISDSYLDIVSLDENNSLLCSRSTAISGKRSYDIIESQIIFDDSTAKSVIMWLENHLTLPHYYVEYEGAPSLYFILSLGDNINLTDDKLGLEKVVGTVTKLQYVKGKCILGFILWISYQGYTS